MKNRITEFQFEKKKKFILFPKKLEINDINQKLNEKTKQTNTCTIGKNKTTTANTQSTLY